MVPSALLLALLAWWVRGDITFGGGGGYGNGGGGGGHGNGNGGYSYDAPLGGRADGLLGGFQGQQGGRGLGQGQAQDPIAALASNIPGGGVPGEDYPILAFVPDTGFSCQDQEFPGYFADTADEAGCQVFHICQFDGRQDSFLCPNGTIFNQQYFVCDWWFNVDCTATEQFLSLNSDIGKVPEGALGAGGGSQTNFGSQQTPSQQYGAPQGGGSGPSGSLQAPSALYGAPSRF